MSRWIYTCNRFKNVRSMLNDGTSRKDILQEMILCCNDIMRKLNKDDDYQWYYEDFTEVKDTLIDVKEQNKISQDELNNCLDYLYDTCDKDDVFLGL